MKKSKNGLLIFIVAFFITACGSIENTSDITHESDWSESESEIISKEEKGSITYPYSLGESFEITAYDVVPYSAYTSEGRQVENPISFKISNIQVLDQQIYTYTPYGDGESVERDNYYLIAFDLEVLDSSVSEPITFNLDYLNLFNLNSNGQEGNTVLGSKAYIPDNYIYFNWQTVMPSKGAEWNFADVIQTKDDKDLAYIMFHYCGEDGEFHNVYVTVEEAESIEETGDLISSSWSFFEENNTIPTPDSCVKDITLKETSDDNYIYDLGNDSYDADMNFKAYGAVLLGCGFTIEKENSLYMILDDSGENVGAMGTGGNEDDSYFLMIYVW